MNFIDATATISPEVLLLILIWTLPWKGWALWHAARQQDRLWFIVILLVQTVGILEIVYLFFIRPYSQAKHEEAQK